MNNPNIMLALLMFGFILGTSLTNLVWYLIYNAERPSKKQRGAKQLK